jgi:hypothetical protein
MSQLEFDLDIGLSSGDEMYVLKRNINLVNFSIKNKYADVTIICNDETELYCSKFSLSKNKYFDGLFSNDFADSSKHCSIFDEEIMNIILNVYYDKNENILQYTGVDNAPVLYEATNYYMMVEAHNLIIKFIIDNIEVIRINPHFIELLFLYKETTIIDKFSEIKNCVSNKLTPLNNVLKKIYLDINAQLFFYLTKNIMTMENQLYIYLLIHWIIDYKDIDDSIIKNILNEHKSKILLLDDISFYYLYNYFKTSSYIESFNYFKIETFDRVMELKDNKYNLLKAQKEELENKIKGPNKK